MESHKLKSYELPKSKNESNFVCEKVPFCKSGHIIIMKHVGLNHELIKGPICDKPQDFKW